MTVEHLISLLKQYNNKAEIKAIGLGSSSVSISCVTSSNFEKNYDFLEGKKEIVYIKLDEYGT